MSQDGYVHDGRALQGEGSGRLNWDHGVPYPDPAIAAPRHQQLQGNGVMET